MGQSTEELFIAGISGGHVWIAPPGTPLPVGLDAPEAPFVDMGYLSEDGWGATPGIETQDIKVWPLLAAARTVVTARTLEVKLKFAQWNADTLAMYWGGIWTLDAASGVRTLTVPSSRTTDAVGVIDASDGPGRTYRYSLGAISLSGFEEVPHKLGEPSLLGCTLKVLPMSADKWFDLHTDDPAVIVPEPPPLTAAAAATRKGRS